MKPQDPSEFTDNSVTVCCQLDIRLESVTWGEGTSTEELPRSDWPVDVSAWAFSLLPCGGRAQFPVGDVTPGQAIGCIKAVVEQASKQRSSIVSALSLRLSSFP